MANDTSKIHEETRIGEFYWGCELNKAKPSVTWSVQEEDEDSDFMHHTLFIKQAVLGAQAIKDEVNIVEVETENFDKEKIKIPFISLTRGESSMCNMDLSFTDSCPVTFTLIDGTGPIYLSAIQLIEFPEDEGDRTMDEEGFTEEEDEIDTPEKPKLKAIKRKGGSAAGASKAKRSKIEASADGDEDEESEEDEEDDDDEEEEDEEDEDDEEMEDDDEEEPTPEKKKAAKKKNAKTAGKAAGKKAEKAPKAKKAVIKKTKK